jgi:hypothetical protein
MPPGWPRGVRTVRQHGRLQRIATGRTPPSQRPVGSPALRARRSGVAGPTYRARPPPPPRPDVAVLLAGVWRAMNHQKVRIAKEVATKVGTAPEARGSLQNGSGERLHMRSRGL